MKKLIFIIGILGLVFLSSCDDDNGDTNELKGIVSFTGSSPFYENGEIVFVAQIQYGAVGEGVDIDYQVLDGDMVIFTESVPIKTNNDGGLNIFFISPEVHIELSPLDDFKGKELTVYLDPENEHTADEYTTEQYISLYKRKTVSIPEEK